MEENNQSIYTILTISEKKAESDKSDNCATSMNQIYLNENIWIEKNALK